MYDDRKGIEIGKCDYSNICNILSEHLEQNKKYHFGLSQKTLRNLNISDYKKNIEEECIAEKAPVSFGNQKYFNAQRTHKKMQNCGVK